ncbi:MAG: hypothetical protein SPI65_03030 [Peptoniphilus sp.]|nr:hypothetical protein [Peptoniphilus sp.]MDD7362769.1 hypothetical protein [Bacillota bacterium]MDY6044535.1 hypothetical protein [Peptoniphilus sp.]
MPCKQSWPAVSNEKVKRKEEIYESKKLHRTARGHSIRRKVIEPVNSIHASDTWTPGESQKLTADGEDIFLVFINGDGAVGYHVDGGAVAEMNLKGEILAKGEGLKEVVIENSGKSDVSTI